jgi:hypothetical protein
VLDLNLMPVVWGRLNEGYGAEDIAVMDDLAVEDVRQCIRQFRNQGKLSAMYGRAKKEWSAA